MVIEEINKKFEEFASKGNYEECESLIYKELDNRNIYNHKDQIFHLATLLYELKFKLKQYEELEIILLELIKFFPDKNIFLEQLVFLYSITNRKSEAEELYAKAIEKDYSDSALKISYLNFLQKENRTEDLIKEGEKLLKDNDEPDIYFILGNVYRENYRFRKAISRYKKYLVLNPNNHITYYNLGVVYAHLDNFTNAIRCYDKAIKINSENKDAHWNKSLLLLASGNFKEGWKEYEFRYDKKNILNRFNNNKIWQGQDLNDKTILVLWEQGFGNVIQFSSLLFVLKQKGAKIILECKDRLIQIMKCLDFIDKIIVKDQKINCSYDYLIPIMSLPAMLNLSLQDIPILTSYLNIKNKSNFDFLETAKIKIGICWRGSKDNISDSYSFVPHHWFTRLCGIPNIQIVSLQYDLLPEEKNDFREKGITIFEENFYKTAELISCLDIVITVDTSIAHLAGAMGKSVWTLLSYNSNWRWMRNRNDTPWYPSMQLIRQKKKENWESVFTEVSALLWAKIIDRYKNDLNIVTKFLVFVKELIDDCKYEFIQLIFKEFNGSKFLTPELMNIFGISLAKAGEIKPGLNLINKALEFNPFNIDLLINKAVILFENNNSQKALLLLEKMKNENPENFNVYYNLGIAKQELGYFTEAKSNFEKAIKINPEFYEASFNKALIDLRDGFWQKGFSGFEKRRKIYLNRFRKYNIPEWKGEKLNNKYIFVYSEEGFGDIIQFSRFLIKLKEMGAKVAFECKPELANLMKKLNVCDKLYDYKQDCNEIEKYDYYIELLSLPYFLVKKTDDLFCNINFADLIEKEKQLDTSLLNVGIVWEGNKNFQYYKQKICSVTEIVESIKDLNLNIYNMQFGITDEKTIKYFEANSIDNFIEDAEDFYDTACKLKTLDLLITIDTAMAHLSGTLGIPGFVLLGKNADWRWGKDEKTVWYQSLKLFRQKEKGNWNSVLKQIRNELKKIIDKKYEKK